MEFSITEKNTSIFVKIHITESLGPHSFFELMDNMSQQIKDVYQQKRLPVVFDLLEISLIDSYMISILVQTFRLTAPEKNVILVSDEQVIDVITLIGIDKMFDIYDSEEEWLADNS
jgi:anti-anti-sigma factor